MEICDLADPNVEKLPSVDFSQIFAIPAALREVVELGRPNRGGLPGRAAYYAKSHVYAYVPTVLVPNV